MFKTLNRSIVTTSLLTLSLAFLNTGTCSARQTEVAATITESEPALEQLFSDTGINGTFVLYDVTAKRMVVHDQARASTRFIPASTFKIPNSLIGLSTGAVSNVDELLPYGGGPQYLKVWEQDMGLRDAIRVSNVPVYQELARRIGLEPMQEYISKLKYGNGEIGTEVDRFWLSGPLKISALEQAMFLARLAQGELPLPYEVQQSVREIVQIDQGDDWVLYAKTGWTTTPTPDIGWWVGWLVRDHQVFSFALNIDMIHKDDAAKRIELGKASLRALGVLD